MTDVALVAGRTQAPDAARRFGLVVDDKEEVRRLPREAGVRVQESGRLVFTDPWGNRVEVLDYREIQFTKAPSVLRGMASKSLARPSRRSTNCAGRDSSVSPRL